MTFTVNSLTRCAGQQHYTLTITVAGQQYTLATDRAEAWDQDFTRDTARDTILARVRSALKESGAATWAQAQAAVEGLSFKI